MTLKQKLMAYSAVASIAAAGFLTNAAADEIALKYESHPLDSAIAEELWGDQLDLAVKVGDVDPDILVANYSVNGEEITVTMMGAMSLCGLNECPVRIFRNKEKVSDFNVCSNTDFHSLSRSGNLFVGCDDITPIPQN